MLHGHVDEVSHRGIEGWAADDGRPDEAIDISIFIDGHKVAQIPCERPREDLMQTGQYGQGNHGFVYRFPKPLAGADEIRVSVRFSQSGSSLVRGECFLGASGQRPVPPPAPLREDEPVMMPPPRDPRAMFDLLVFYDEVMGLTPLLSRLALDAYKPQQVHYSVFGILPETPVKPPPDLRYYPRDHLNELLLSDEFQSRVLPLLLRAYEDKQRLIFIHIPKCAGTDLSNKLKTRYPWVNFNIMDSDWTKKDAMLLHLSRLAQQIRFADRLYLCGHGALHYYARRHLIRPTDEVFTIVRQPSGVILSQVNYVLTRFWLDAERGEAGPDTQEWLGLIGIDALPSQMSDEFVHDAGMRILQNPHIVKPNSVCYWLAGDGADAQAALDGLMAQNVEVTDTGRYSEWLAQRWGVHSQSRDNSSMKFLTMEMLPREYRDYIRDISVEDVKLYRAVDRSITRLGKPSVTGLELAGSLE